MFWIIMAFSTNTTYPGRLEGPAHVDGVKRHLSDHHILYHVSNVIIINTLSRQPLQVYEVPGLEWCPPTPTDLIFAISLI